MTTEIIKQEVVKIIAEIFKDMEYNTNVIDQTDLMNDFGMDSVIFISVVVEIETHFDIEVSDELLLPENFKCVDNIVKIVKTEIDKKRTKILS